MIESFAALFIVAVLVEGIVEYFVSKPEVEQPWLKYVAALLSVTICILYNLDLFAAFGLVSAVPFVGSVLTGFVIGRGSNYLNDFISNIREPKVVYNIVEDVVNQAPPVRPPSFKM